jgi:c-di-GMP-binding flagellar brake protein YcgR
MLHNNRYGECFMERRLFPRIYKSIQLEYKAQLQGSDDFFSNRAVVKDISWGGVYFITETAAMLQPDDIADFIFKFRPDQVHPLIPHKIRAQGKVRRIEQPTKESSYFGVVLEFLSGPFFIYAD